MAMYTYVVDHGDKSPTIKAGMYINGGKLTAVSFCDQLEQNDKARELLKEIMCGIVDNDTAQKIEEVLQLI